MKYITINSVKDRAEINSPDILIGYLMNSEIFVPIANENGDYIAIQKWIDDGNIPEPAFTQAELDTYESSQVKKQQEDLMKGGQLVGLENDSRISVGSPEIITGIEEYNQWMFDLYYNYDNGKLFIPAPPLEIIDNLKMFGVDINEYN